MTWSRLLRRALQAAICSETPRIASLRNSDRIVLLSQVLQEFLPQWLIRHPYWVKFPSLENQARKSKKKRRNPRFSTCLTRSFLWRLRKKSKVPWTHLSVLFRRSNRRRWPLSIQSCLWTKSSRRPTSKSGEMLLLADLSSSKSATSTKKHLKTSLRRSASRRLPKKHWSSKKTPRKWWSLSLKQTQISELRLAI